MSLHPKIKELKRRAAPISFSAVNVNERGELTGDFEELLDKRILQGYLLRWGTKNMHGEKFLKGCCAKSIQERGPNSPANYKITFLNQHQQREALCVFDELVEDSYGLRFRTKPLDDVPWADHVLIQVRSGTLNQFSAGFDYIWDKMEWDDSDESIICKEIDLLEGSIVTIGSEVGTYVIRTKEEEDYLAEETNSFIKLLPRQHQLEARQLFARHKSLQQIEPAGQRKKPLKSVAEPVGTGIDYKYLLENLKSV